MTKIRADEKLRSTKIVWSDIVWEIIHEIHFNDILQFRLYIISNPLFSLETWPFERKFRVVRKTGKHTLKYLIWSGQSWHVYMLIFDWTACIYADIWLDSILFIYRRIEFNGVNTYSWFFLPVRYLPSFLKRYSASWIMARQSRDSSQ